MELRRTGRLSRGQVECLLLAHDHLTSKEIAVRLGISPHTVDQRVRQSLQILGVKRRTDAAKIVAEAQLGRATRLNVADLPEMDTAAFLPVATKKHPTNTMSVALRLFWIVAIACGAIVASMMYLAGLQSLSRMLG